MNDAMLEVPCNFPQADLNDVTAKPSGRPFLGRQTDGGAPAISHDELQPSRQHLGIVLLVHISY
jgi:hypothetical protein